MSNIEAMVETRIGPGLAVHRRGNNLVVVGTSKQIDDWLRDMHTIAEKAGYISADMRTLVDFFRHERPDEGWQGDERGDTTIETAIHVMRKQKEEIDRLSGDLRKVIEVAHRHGWNGVENSKILWDFLDTALTTGRTTL